MNYNEDFNLSITSTPTDQRALTPIPRPNLVFLAPTRETFKDVIFILEYLKGGEYCIKCLF